jgi:hypothetical protein
VRKNDFQHETRSVDHRSDINVRDREQSESDSQRSSEDEEFEKTQNDQDM